MLPELFAAGPLLIAKQGYARPVLLARDRLIVRRQECAATNSRSSTMARFTASVLAAAAATVAAVHAHPDSVLRGSVPVETKLKPTPFGVRPVECVIEVPNGAHVEEDPHSSDIIVRLLTSSPCQTLSCLWPISCRCVARVHQHRKCASRAFHVR